METLRMNLGESSYDIHIGKGILHKAAELFNLERRVFIITDSGVPEEYAKRVESLCREAKIFTVPEGEGSKSLATLESVLKEMCGFNMGRGDAAVAVGGGVVGDLTGFAAACYMRGIDFYNIPTTVLSSVDSSIGGKTAVNLGGIKNIVGAFHQPKCVLIDTELLETLPKRQISNGLAEAIKMAATRDPELFSLFESRDCFANDTLLDIIIASLKIKKAVVEEDERESGLRKVLNFGHTLGHGIEAETNMESLYHGECVALGMLPVCSESVRKRLIAVLERAELPTRCPCDIEKALGYIIHDKKCSGGMINAVLVDEIGSFRFEKMTVDSFSEKVRAVYK